MIFYSNRFGVNIKDTNDRTPIHCAFRSSKNLSKIENQFQIETDFGDKVLKKYIYIRKEFFFIHTDPKF